MIYKYAATLPTVEDLELIPLEDRKYCGGWWTQTGYKDFHGVVRMVSKDGSLSMFASNFPFRVRPILIISSYSSYHDSDEFVFGGKKFKTISDSKAFCCEDIGKAKFNENWVNTNDYQTSSIKEIVDSWFYAAAEKEAKETGTLTLSAYDKAMNKNYYECDKADAIEEFVKCPICEGKLATLEKNMSDGRPMFRQVCAVCFFESGPLKQKKNENKRKQDIGWRSDVLETDNNRCRICGSTENLEAHHIIPVSHNKEYERNVGNGVCLCKKCHWKVHHKQDGRWDI